MPKIHHINFNYKFESTKVTPNVTTSPVVPAGGWLRRLLAAVFRTF